VVTAYILIQTEVGKAAQVAKDIIDIKGVQQAEDVTGPYDVIVRAEARNIDELGKLVVARIQAVDGITRTLTCPVVHLQRCSTTFLETADSNTDSNTGGSRRSAASGCAGGTQARNADERR
jgi:DNA-binding Lrp family transcriptional regulator